MSLMEIQFLTMYIVLLIVVVIQRVPFTAASAAIRTIRCSLQEMSPGAFAALVFVVYHIVLIGAMKLYLQPANEAVKADACKRIN